MTITSIDANKIVKTDNSNVINELYNASIEITSSENTSINVDAVKLLIKDYLDSYNNIYSSTLTISNEIILI